MSTHQLYYLLYAVLQAAWIVRVANQSGKQPMREGAKNLMFFVATVLAPIVTVILIWDFAIDALGLRKVK